MTKAIFISTDDIDDLLFDKILKIVSTKTKDRYEQALNKEKGKSIVVGEFLLRYLIFLVTEIPLENIEISKNNQKPFCVQLPNYYLSLSHSEKAVFTVISDLPVGCDVQKMKKVSLRSLSTFFSSLDCEHILKSDNPLFEFYNLWTRKESFIKFMEDGYDFKNISFYDCSLLQNKFNVSLYTEQLFSEYLFTVVFKDFKTPLNIERVYIRM